MESTPVVDVNTEIKRYVDTAEQLAQTPEENAALSLELIGLMEHLGKVQFRVFRKSRQGQPVTVAAKSTSIFLGGNTKHGR